jgi:vancomycin resistance protein VanW
MKRKVLAIFPSLYRLRVRQLSISRHLKNMNPLVRFARRQLDYNLPYTCKKHQSLLRRKLGSSDPLLQENKVTNLKLSTPRIDGVVIRPGETFSFWKLVGKTTAKRGYIEGLLLSQGDVKTGIGGGICQLANLLFWLAIHTPLIIAERHHHSFDPFPDDQRALPFGSGASVFYNYIDLRFHNPTKHSFQFKLWVTDQHLKGSIHSNMSLAYTYHIEERNHRFHQKAGKNYRENEIWRKVVDKATGNTMHEELLIHNYSEVKYELTFPVPVVQ